MGGCWRNEELGEIVETILGMLGDDIAKAKVLSDLLVTELSLLRTTTTTTTTTITNLSWFLLEPHSI